MNYLYNSTSKTKLIKSNIIDLIVGFMSLFIFLYRFILVAIPMFKEAYNQENYHDMALSLTMLV